MHGVVFMMVVTLFFPYFFDGHKKVRLAQPRISDWLGGSDSQIYPSFFFQKATDSLDSSHTTITSDFQFTLLSKP